MLPLIKTLVSPGSSGNIDEIYEKVAELEKLDVETFAGFA